MKIKINTKVINELRPCQDRMYNWLKHYNDFDGDILDFLSLTKITSRDKVWVSVRVLPEEIRGPFAWDCMFRASAYHDTVAASHAYAAAYAADYAAYAADYAADYAANYAAYAANYAAYATAAACAEGEMNVGSLIYLISNE